MISEAKAAAKYLNTEDERHNVGCLEIFLCPCFYNFHFCWHAGESGGRVATHHAGHRRIWVIF